MSSGHSLVERFGRSDWSLSALLVLLVVDIFILGPLIQFQETPGVLTPAVFLLLGLAWTFAYTLVALGDPAAFSFPAATLNLQNLHARLLYFSTMTLTTVGYGDITPVNPVARSLAALEAITRQLFPVILLARLVSMELHYR
jgi:voltage-gated potassium channel Kch